MHAQCSVDDLRHAQVDHHRGERERDPAFGAANRTESPKSIDRTGASPGEK